MPGSSRRGYCPGPPHVVCAARIKRWATCLVDGERGRGKGDRRKEENGERGQDGGDELGGGEGRNKSARRRTSVLRLRYDEGRTKKDDKRFRLLCNGRTGCLPNRNEKEQIMETIRKDTMEIYTGDGPNFALDLIESMAMKIMDPKMEHRAKTMEIRTRANTISNVIRIMEEDVDREINRRYKYREGYFRMKEQYMNFRRKYEALVGKRDTKEKENPGQNDKKGNEGERHTGRNGNGCECIRDKGGGDG